MKNAIYLLIGFIVLSGCSETKQVTYLQRQPVACIYLDGFTTVQNVRKVGERSQMGIVIVKEDNSRKVFSAMVIPFKKIPIGTKVRLIDIQYSQIQGGGSKNHLDCFMLVLVEEE